MANYGQIQGLLMMHRFLAARSNITPPVVTTGVGPHGRKIVHLQAPDAPKDTGHTHPGPTAPVIDPALIDRPVTPYSLPSSPEADESPSSAILIDSSPVAATKRHGKAAILASNFDQALSKASALRPGKVSFEDKLVDLSATMMQNANRREEVRLALEERRLEQDSTQLRIKEVAQVMQLHEMGMLDKAAMKARIDIIDERYDRLDRLVASAKRAHSPEASGSGSSSSSHKRMRHSRSQSSSSLHHSEPSGSDFF
ncbi:hypothetical protein B0H11DRAFT_2406327 [Mycena galericulata]|nr:hypothetical protein B0H11DRAFT_2406327 [Mycena galericulata]